MPKCRHFARVGAEAAVGAGSAFEEPAAAVGCGTPGAGDEAGKLFGEALVAVEQERRAFLIFSLTGKFDGPERHFRIGSNDARDVQSSEQSPD